MESPAAYSSPEASVLTRLFTKLFSDYLNELSYPADLAGVFVILNVCSENVECCLLLLLCTCRARSATS